MKKILLLILSIICIRCYADTDKETVQYFAVNLENWSMTKNISALRNIEENFSTKQTIILDRIAEDLAKKNNVAANSTYRLDLYLSWLQKEIMSGAKIVTSGIEDIPLSELSNINTKDCGIVKCTFTLSGTSTISSNDILYVRNGKVLKIDNYTEVSTPSGKKKVNVDFSDVYIDDPALGISYNYSKHFPFGISAQYCPGDSPFMIGLDFGWSGDNSPIINEKMDYTDISNFNKTRAELKPKFFLTLTPGVNFKYFSFGLGVGFMTYMGKEYNENYVTTYMGNTSDFSSGSVTVSGLSSAIGATVTSEERFNFMLRPNIKCYIPTFDDEHFLSIGVGYDYIFKYTNQNGINYSLGFQVLL